MIYVLIILIIIFILLVIHSYLVIDISRYTIKDKRIDKNIKMLLLSDLHNRDINDKFQSKGKGKEHDKSKVKCFRCHNLGHYVSECYISCLRIIKKKGKIQILLK